MADRRNLAQLAAHFADAVFKPSQRMRPQERKGTRHAVERRPDRGEPPLDIGARFGEQRLHFGARHLEHVRIARVVEGEIIPENAAARLDQGPQMSRQLGPELQIEEKTVEAMTMSNEPGSRSSVRASPATSMVAAGRLVRE